MKLLIFYFIVKEFSNNFNAFSKNYGGQDSLTIDKEKRPFTITMRELDKLCFMKEYSFKIVVPIDEFTP